MSYHTTIDGVRWVFPDLKALLAKASPPRSGDVLAGVAARSAIERVAAQMALADLPLKAFLNADLVPYEEDEVSRLILDSHDPITFAAVSHMTVGEFREWLLDTRTSSGHLTALAPGLTPEMTAAVSKIMRAQDLIVVAAKCRVTTAFRNTIGLPGRLSTRLQPNHPTDDSRGIAASLIDGLMFGVGDAVIGVNPATDGVQDYVRVARKRPIGDSDSTCRCWRKLRMRRFRLREARSAATSRISKPAKAARCRRTRISGSTSRRWKRAPTPSRDGSSRCWSIR
jgi:ethanolamine ammonia-lyase large subunit